MKYTIEQFEIDFENATIDKKGEVLNKALDALDFSDPNFPQWKESLLKYKEDLQDLKDQMEIDEDILCNRDIESGNLQLYTCIKKYYDFIEGYNYYVGIDDYASEMKSKWIDGASEEHSEKYKGMMDAIKKLKPLIYIYRDNGIGTLKKRIIFGKVDEFSNYFKKFENN